MHVISRYCIHWSELGSNRILQEFPKVKRKLRTWTMYQWYMMNNVSVKYGCITGFGFVFNWWNKRWHIVEWETCSCYSLSQHRKLCSWRSFGWFLGLFFFAKFPATFPTTFPTTFPAEFPARFPTAFPTAFPTRFPAELPIRFPTKFPNLDADWLAPHHPFQMLNFHQSLPW